MSTLLSRRSFTLDDHASFARIAGDFNPVHVDAVRARREYFGTVVVHGIHTVLVALDGLADRLRQRGVEAIRIDGLRVEFPAPVAPGQTVVTEVVSWALGEGAARLEQRCEGRRVTRIDLRWSREVEPPGAGGGAESDGWEPGDPDDRGFEELEGVSGTTPLRIDEQAVRRRFGSLLEVVPARDVAQLLAVSRVVGMHCPGLRSMLSTVELEASPGVAPEDRVEFRTVGVDERFSLVTVELVGPTLRGTARAFYRPGLRRQPSFQTVRTLVRPDRFEGQSALVIGGSRGLGEVTAKLLAAGGARVAVTWLRGEEDARRVVEEITSAGGWARAARLDVADPAPGLEEIASGDGLRPTHLYYYASPKIFVARSAPFDPDLFRGFCAAYVDGFHRTVRASRRLWEGNLVVLYPSTVALSERVRALAEYAAAKAAGEDLARHLTRFEPGVRVEIERLPRIETDQTATLTPVPGAEADRTLLPVLERLHPADAPADPRVSGDPASG
ncbi:MAG: SDR family NAD(P)-dependent oxidoreductase [Gemmatimonadota bacterium]|jgi:acyl dehydratase/NAD(P)-dependent dehydrogenase (short-subunit alcohol dehydrogenase family)